CFPAIEQRSCGKIPHPNAGIRAIGHAQHYTGYEDDDLNVGYCGVRRGTGAYFFSGVFFPVPTSEEIPKSRWRRVSPSPANTSEQVSRRRSSAAPERVSSTAFECWPSVV